MPRSSKKGQSQLYIALLRGINVGGKSTLKMDELRRLFESFGLSDVATYIQSGNVIFSSPAPRRELQDELEHELRQSTGMPLAVFLLTSEELRDAAAHNPFEPERLDRQQRCHLMFLSAEPDDAHREALMRQQGTEYRFHVRGKVFYYAYDRKHEGRGRRTIDFEKLLGVRGTSRTWKVVDKLIELTER